MMLKWSHATDITNMGQVFYSVATGPSVEPGFDCL